MLVFVFRSLRMRHTSSLRARLRLTFDSIAETCRLSTTLSASRNSAVASCKLRTCAMLRVLANPALFLSLSISLFLFVHSATTIAHEYILINNLCKQNVLNLLRICTFSTSAGNVSFNVRSPRETHRYISSIDRCTRISITIHNKPLFTFCIMGLWSIRNLNSN